ncbi:hypothetical protein IJH19_00400 [Candidatus Saccharibacteria bacterium]|nr:hypothetical protein [Candidatus Saccharibacteria bacterium]
MKNSIFKKFSSVAEDLTVFKAPEEPKDEETKTEETKDEAKAEAEGTEETKEDAEPEPEETKDKSEESKDEATKDEAKAEPEETKAEVKAETEEVKAETEETEEPSKAIKPEGDVLTPEPTPEPKPEPKPAAMSSDQFFTVNGDMEMKIFKYGSDRIPASNKEAFVESAEKITFSNDEENGFRDGSVLHEVKRARDEGEIPGAAVKFSELVMLKSPEFTVKFIRKHIADAIEADPELLEYIHEVDKRKHQIEKRFRPSRPELATELWDEATARPYIDSRKSELPPRLAAEATDEDYGQWILVEYNADTGALRELTEAESAKQAKTQPEAKAEGN